MFRLFMAVLMMWVSTGVMAKSIMVLGDSISAAYGIEVDQGWVALLQAKRNKSQLDYTRNNVCISGDT
ncbi:MAG: arylesterase, partial [Methylovulum sp.]|nr:arylesterase [Methylovulum sp.]